MHLYGGAAAMRNGVMPLQWEGKCLVQELFVALSFSFAFAFALACAFSKFFAGSFLGALAGAFLGAFLGAFGVNFPLPLFLPGMWSGGRSESLPLPFTLVSTWWGSNGVCKRREVVIVLPGGIVREGLLSGSAAAFGG